MSNLTKYFCEASEDQDGFPVASMKEHAEGEWVKFEDIADLLNTSTNSVSHEMPGFAMVETNLFLMNADAPLNDRPKMSRIAQQVYDIIARHFGQ